LDVRELHAFGQVGFPAMDLGSGGGVPGLLSALIREDRWVLAESEKMKANFLRNVVEEMGLPHVEVVADRAEAWLRSGRVDSIVARAVGKIQKIFAWIEHRSTWNNLILLKGPGWEAEWAEFQATPARNRLRVVSEHRYEVGADHKKRVIIRIERNVPRGTMATR
jgi:16S rRNA (guanine(527)-N(7))-methyltransferase RsmG